MLWGYSWIDDRPDIRRPRPSCMDAVSRDFVIASFIGKKIGNRPEIFLQRSVPEQCCCGYELKLGPKVGGCAYDKVARPGRPSMRITRSPRAFATKRGRLCKQYALAHGADGRVVLQRLDPGAGDICCYNDGLGRKYCNRKTRLLFES